MWCPASHLWLHNHQRRLIIHFREQEHVSKHGDMTVFRPVYQEGCCHWEENSNQVSKEKCHLDITNLIREASFGFHSSLYLRIWTSNCVENISWWPTPTCSLFATCYFLQLNCFCLWLHKGTISNILNTFLKNLKLRMPFPKLAKVLKMAIFIYPHVIGCYLLTDCI